MRCAWPHYGEHKKKVWRLVAYCAPLQWGTTHGTVVGGDMRVVLLGKEKEEENSTKEDREEWHEEERRPEEGSSRRY